MEMIINLFYHYNDYNENTSFMEDTCRHSLRHNFVFLVFIGDFSFVS